MKNKNRFLVITFIIAILCPSLYAAKSDTTFIAKGNPVINYKYLGDPAALVHNGTVYITLLKQRISNGQRVRPGLVR